MTWHMRTVAGVFVRQTGGIGMPGRAFFFFLDGSTVTRSNVELRSDVVFCWSTTLWVACHVTVKRKACSRPIS